MERFAGVMATGLGPLFSTPLSLQFCHIPQTRDLLCRKGWTKAGGDKSCGTGAVQSSGSITGNPNANSGSCLLPAVVRACHRLVMGVWLSLVLPVPGMSGADRTRKGGTPHAAGRGTAVSGWRKCSWLLSRLDWKQQPRGYGCLLLSIPNRLDCHAQWGQSAPSRSWTPREIKFTVLFPCSLLGVRGLYRQLNRNLRGPILLLQTSGVDETHLLQLAKSRLLEVRAGSSPFPPNEGHGYPLCKAAEVSGVTPTLDWDSRSSGGRGGAKGGVSHRAVSGAKPG